MSDPNVPPYKAPVVATDEYSTTYENGVTLPRQGFAHEDALAFEQAGQQPNIFQGIERMPNPMGGFGHGPLLAWQPGDLSPTEDPYPQAEGEAITAAYERSQRGGQMPDPVLDAGVPAPTVYQEGSGVPMAAPVAPATVAEPPMESSVEAYQAQQAPVVPPMGAPAPPNTLTPEQIEQRNREQLNPTAPAAPAATDNAAWVTSNPSRGQSYRIPPPVVRGGSGGPRVRQTTQVVEGVPIPQELMIQRGQEIQSQVAATQALAAQRAADAQARADQIGQQVADQNVRNAANQQNETERQAAMRQADANYQSAIADFQKQAVDPAKWYHDRGTAGTVLAAIAMGLGAFAQTLTGGENNALKIIQSAIQDDIESQRINIANSREGVALKGNLLSEMRARFGDERSAELATEAALTRQAANQAAQLEAAAQASGAPIEGDLASQALRQRSTEAEIELRNREANRRTVQTQGQSGGGGGGGMSAQQRAAARVAEIEAGVYVPGLIIPDESSMVAATHLQDSEKKELRKIVAPARQLQNYLNRMELIARQGISRRLPRAQAAAEMTRVRNLATVSLNSAMGLGVLDNGAMAILNGIIPSDGLFDASIIPQIRNARALFYESANTSLFPYGYQLEGSTPTPERATPVGE